MATPDATRPTPTAQERFAALDRKVGPKDYNYEHFRIKHLLQDGRRTLRECGIPPGRMAPDFELPRVGGGTLRLSELRGKPALLHFGSFT